LKKIFFILLALTATCQQLSAQQHRDDDLVQFAGVVVSADSTRLLPLVSIRLKNTNKGTYSDASGFFSFVAKKTDTIVFSSIGMRTVQYVIPADITASKFSIIQTMQEDTIYLPETVVRPGPSPEEFNYYFVRANIPDEYYTRASGNLRQKTLQSVSAGMTMDGRENQDYMMQAYTYQYYYQGQLPPQRLFDPIAWSQFFKSWNKDKDKKK
jgi:hypothetical protein